MITNKSKIYPLVVKRGRLSSKKGPVLSLINDLEIVFEYQGDETTSELIKHKVMEGDYDIYQLYNAACENIVRDVEFVIANTMYGAFAIIADGIHEASALCFKSIWITCIEKLKDDLIIMVPSADTILFAPASQTEVVTKMIEHGVAAYNGSSDKISKELFIFLQKERELKVYEAQN
ncbi:MAG: hypothetical protein ACK5LL_14410 [Suipraeoptans sp.]